MVLGGCKWMLVVPLFSNCEKTNASISLVLVFVAHVNLHVSGTTIGKQTLHCLRLELSKAAGHFVNEELQRHFLSL